MDTNIKTVKEAQYFLHSVYCCFFFNKFQEECYFELVVRATTTVHKFFYKKGAKKCEPVLVLVLVLVL